MNGIATAAPGSDEARAPQHIRALERANRVRLARAALKRRVAEGELTAADVILSSPWEAESMTLADLLTSQRRWGRTRCRKFLTSLQISENKAVGSLTERQRRTLAAQLAGAGTDGASWSGESLAAPPYPPGFDRPTVDAAA